MKEEQDIEPLVLSDPEDIDKFLNILLDNSEPNDNLKRAFERYRNMIDGGKLKVVEER